MLRGPSSARKNAPAELLNAREHRPRVAQTHLDVGWRPIDHPATSLGPRCAIAARPAATISKKLEGFFQKNPGMNGNSVMHAPLQPDAKLAVGQLTSATSARIISATSSDGDCGVPTKSRVTCGATWRGGGIGPLPRFHVRTSSILFVSHGQIGPRITASVMHRACSHGRSKMESSPCRQPTACDRRA